MLFLQNKTFGIPIIGPRMIAPTTLPLFGTVQFTEARTGRYKGYDEYDLRYSARKIIQRQMYMFYTWCLNRYSMQHIFKKTMIKSKFFEITPDNFEPDEEEIALYLWNPKFMWLFSMANYENVIKLFQSDTAENKVLFQVFPFYTDTSPLVPYLEAHRDPLKKVFGMSKKLDFQPFDFNKVAQFNESFQFKLDKYETSEYFFSNDFHIHEMDGNTSYTEFIQVLLTGACKRYTSNLQTQYVERESQLRLGLNFIKQKAKPFKNTEQVIKECFELLGERSKESKSNLSTIRNYKFKPIHHSLRIGSRRSISNALEVFNYENQDPIRAVLQSSPICFFDDGDKTCLNDCSKANIKASYSKYNDPVFYNQHAEIEYLYGTALFKQTQPDSAICYMGVNINTFPLFINGHLNELVKKREQQIQIKDSLFTHSHWNENMCAVEEHHPFPFYKLIKRCFGYCVDLNKYIYVDENGKRYRVGWKLPFSEEVNNELIYRYLSIVEEHGWLDTYSARLIGKDKKGKQEWESIKTEIEGLIIALYSESKDKVKYQASSLRSNNSSLIQSMDDSEIIVEDYNFTSESAKNDVPISGLMDSNNVNEITTYMRDHYELFENQIEGQTQNVINPSHEYAQPNDIDSNKENELRPGETIFVSKRNNVLPQSNLKTIGGLDINFNNNFNIDNLQSEAIYKSKQIKTENKSKCNDGDFKDKSVERFTDKIELKIEDKCESRFEDIYEYEIEERIKNETYKSKDQIEDNSEGQMEGQIESQMECQLEDNADVQLEDNAEAQMEGQMEIEYCSERKIEFNDRFAERFADRFEDKFGKDEEIDQSNNVNPIYNGLDTNESISSDDSNTEIIPKSSHSLDNNSSLLFVSQEDDQTISDTSMDSLAAQPDDNEELPVHPRAFKEIPIVKTSKFLRIPTSDLSNIITNFDHYAPIQGVFKSLNGSIIQNGKLDQKPELFFNFKIEMLPGEEIVPIFYPKKVCNVYMHARYTCTRPRTAGTEGSTIFEDSPYAPKLNFLLMFLRSTVDLTFSNKFIGNKKNAKLIMVTLDRRFSDTGSQYFDYVDDYLSLINSYANNYLDEVQRDKRLHPTELLLKIIPFNIKVEFDRKNIRELATYLTAYFTKHDNALNFSTSEFFRLIVSFASESNFNFNLTYVIARDRHLSEIHFVCQYFDRKTGSKDMKYPLDCFEYDSYYKDLVNKLDGAKEGLNFPYNEEEWLEEIDVGSCEDRI